MSLKSIRDEKYSSDSFERFGDDLCELLLSYLSVKQKKRFECVSKQWQRLVFNKQQKLIIKFSYEKKVLTQLLYPKSIGIIITYSTVCLKSLNSLMI